MTNIKVNTPSETNSAAIEGEDGDKARSKFAVDHSSVIKNEDKEIEQVISTEIDKPKEHGGPKGLEPTRYGDWERKGRCVDF